MSDLSVLSVVVIPARNERERVSACLEALAVQTVGVDAFEVILVADGCSDDTAVVARSCAQRLGLALSILDGPQAGSGPARRLGMEAAAARLEALGVSGGLIATTDADSRPAGDWLERQLTRLADGAEVVAGYIELEHDGDNPLSQQVLRRRERDALTRLDAVRRTDPDAGHHHFAGASLGITARAYRQIGGIDPTPSLEDEMFAQKLTRHGIRIQRARDVVVRTAARTDGRAHRGLAVDLAVANWQESRRFSAADFSDLSAAQRRDSVTVIIPARECADTVTGVITRTVMPVIRAGLVDRVIVVDADSADGTAEIARAAGADVFQQDLLHPELGPAQGKGDAMWRALGATGGDIVCFLDADTADPTPDHLLGLLGPLLWNQDIQLVKGTFDRPLRQGDRTLADEGGRVTELTARPLINLHFPLLAPFSQPLAGEFAARRPLLESLAFPVGYGVEIAILIDALARHGLPALAECHLGTRQNRHQPLRSLSEMSFAVLAAVEQRIADRPSVITGRYLRPWDGGDYVRVPLEERPPLCSLAEDLDRTDPRVILGQR